MNSFGQRKNYNIFIRAAIGILAKHLLPSMAVLTFLYLDFDKML